MSDSDDDSLQNNVFMFQNDNTTISARGPNVNNTNNTGLSFRNNFMTSSMHMPVNFERPRYGGSNFDQRSMSCRRETSPMSLRGVPSYGAPGFNRSVYYNGMSSQRSMYNGRGGSPVSIRSMDSTASVSAADIVFAFKNVKFNKYDLRIIKDAYHKLIKSKQRKRIEKRRNLKLFLKGTRWKSGEDDGEQGSESSISSDDCRSVRTTICKENISGLRQLKDVSHFDTNMQGGRNNVTDVPHFGNNTRDVSMFMDRTDNIKHNSLRNMLAISNNMSSCNNREKSNTMIENKNQTAVKVQNLSVVTQKERFQKGFLLPSQRFNKTVIGQTQVNNNQKAKKLNQADQPNPLVSDSASDEDEIFNQHNTQTILRKRSLDAEDINYANKKRNKSDSPKKLPTDLPQSLINNILNEKSNDFIFAKPKMPIKKVSNKKKVPEKLLAKSHVLLQTEDIDFQIGENKKAVEENKAKDLDDHTETETLHSNSDVSMRPSFIKRKLFTQKLDMAEQKNTSCDSLGTNSPQNIYSASMRERSRARKLVTSQSCLSREVAGEDNVLDLIHKIVPPDQINITNVANKTEPCNKSNDVDNNNKWDVSTVIANCDSQDISDTYTDEEIFNVNQDKKSENPKKSQQDLKKIQQCSIVVQKLEPKTIKSVLKNNNNNQFKLPSKVPETSKKTITDCVKSFWDTDFESDTEFNAPAWKTNNSNNIQQNKETVPQKRNNDPGDNKNRSIIKAPISKGTILTVRSYHKESMLNNSLISRKSPNSNDKNCIDPKHNSIELKMNNTNVDKINKDPNTMSQTGKKKDSVKENVPVNNKSEETIRKPKSKQCVDCINDKPTPKKPIKNAKLTKCNDVSDNKKHVTRDSSKNANSGVKTNLKSKESKNIEPNQTGKNNMNKVKNTDQKNNTKSQKEPINYGRIQPKRKSKEKSFVQTKQITITKNNKTPNKMSKSKSNKESISNNTSINNISTIITRSREKLLSFNSSQDYSSMDLSNLSNRSLRLRQRVERNKN